MPQYVLCDYVLFYMCDSDNYCSIFQGLEGPPGQAGPHGDPGIPVSCSCGRRDNRFNQIVCHHRSCYVSLRKHLSIA